MNAAAADPADASSAGAFAVEVESTYDVDDSTPLPDWSTLPRVVRVGKPERRDLDARYVDTDDFALARQGIAVRRRRGGPDEGWHMKGPREGSGRRETHWPLGDVRDDETDPIVPQEIQDAVAGWARPPFLPLARLRNHRTAYALTDADGAVVAEFVDDRVHARDERRGVESSWREWEMELGPAGPADDRDRAAFFAAVDAAVAAAGGRPAASDSKLARALGH